MSEKKVSEAIEYRRSVRVFDDEKEIDPNVVKNASNRVFLPPTVVIFNFGNFITLPMLT